MTIKITTQTTIDEFLHAVLPNAYKAGLHRVPAKYATDMYLLLHSMTALLVADLLMGFLGRQARDIEQHLAQFKEEIWLATFLHDILKEANVRGERIDHQDIQPDDVTLWLEQLGIQPISTRTIRLAARVAVHERGGLPLFSAFADVEQDDLPQLVIRLSDQLASLTSINEHWHYEGHGLPNTNDTLNGRGRFKGINQRIQALGAPESLSLFSHYHTRLTYPYLTNQLLAGTVASIRALGPEPILVLADGVIYVGTQSQYALVEQRSTDDSNGGLAANILNNTWERIAAAIVASPLRPEDIRSTKNGMKIFGQLRLLGTPLAGEQDLFTTIGISLAGRVSTKTFAQKSAREKPAEIQKHISNTLKLLDKLPKIYGDTLVSQKSPELQLGDEKLRFSDLPAKSTCPADDLRAKTKGMTDAAMIGFEFQRFGDSLAELVGHANVQEFWSNLQQRTRAAFESAIYVLIDGGIVIANTPLKLSVYEKKLVDRYCSMCGQQAFKSKEAKIATIKQRETFFPIKVKSHTNSSTSAEPDGTRVVCQTCWLELGLRGMGFSAESFKNKQSVLHLHLLPFFAFPMNWMDAVHQQFGLAPRESRVQFSEKTLAILSEALFSQNESVNDWEWIRRIAKPLQMMTNAFFANETEPHNRDEFFGMPPLDVAGSVTLSLYTRRSERKPNGIDLEDEIGRKEMWTRGVTLATLLAEALPVRVVVSESPLVSFDPAEIKSSLTLVNPPEVITSIMSRFRTNRSIQSRFDPGENAVSHTELRDLLKLLVFILRVNKTLGGVSIGKDGREYNKRRSRQSVELVQAIADEMLTGAWLHQRDWQSRSREYRPRWDDENYRLFTQSCLEVDKMLNPKEVDRLRAIARITQTFYSPPICDSAHALTLPFKIATKVLQKFNASSVNQAELETIMRSDIESAIRRQANVEGSRAWIVLKRKKTIRKIEDPPVATQLTEGVRAFADAFMRDIVRGICGDLTNFLILRKRLQSGYLLQMKDLSLETWEREELRMFKVRTDSEPDEANDDLSMSA